MTSHPLRSPADSRRLRVVPGRKGLRRWLLAPWSIVVIVAVVGFLGLGFAQTSLDKSAFELADLEKAIAEQDALNEELKMEVARLENPARIAPLAEGLGMVLPQVSNQIVVDLSPEGPEVVANGRLGGSQ